MTAIQPPITRKKVFDFETAITGKVVIDHKGGRHDIVAKGTRFIITKCDGVEHCFNAEGKQFETFPSLQLSSPSAIKCSIPTYVVYKKSDMSIVDYFDSSKGYGVAEENADYVCINTSSPTNEELLKTLGIERRTWIERDGGSESTPSM
jgi:hypothetical protein